MAGDAKLIAFIENLFVRPKGVRDTYNRITQLSADVLAAIAEVSGKTSLRTVQGNAILSNDYQTEMDYLDAIWRALQTIIHGPPQGGRQPSRTVILPGDATLYSQWSSVPNLNTFTSVAGIGYTSQQQYFPAPAFSTDRPFINFPNMEGWVQTARGYGFGYVAENAQVVELNAAFLLPTGVSRNVIQYGSGFGMVNRPLTEANAVGIWVEPNFNIGGNVWASPYPVTVYIARGDGHPSAFSIPDLQVPASDSIPGAVAISWNRYRIAIYLSRGSRGMSSSPAVPRYWLYPWAPNAWPWPWPYHQQTPLLQVGNPTFYPGITSVAIPAPVAVAATWNPFQIAIREIDIEETPIYPGTPIAGSGAIDPVSLKVEV